MDPEVHFECHQCHGPIAADLDMLGDPITCPHCKSTTAVPPPPTKHARHRRPWLWPTLFIAFLVLYAVAGVVITRITSTEDPTLAEAQASPSITPEQAIATLTLPEQLAYLEHDSPGFYDPVVAARFESLLTQLDSKYTESRKGIATLACHAHDELLRNGIVESRLSLLEGLNRITIINRNPNEKFSGLVAIYLVSRNGGLTRDESLAGLQSLAALADGDLSPDAREIQPIVRTFVEGADHLIAPPPTSP